MGKFTVGDRVNLRGSEPEDRPGTVTDTSGKMIQVLWDEDILHPRERGDDGLVRHPPERLYLLAPAEPIIHDAVNHPSHYVSHPSGIECIQITEHMGFNLGNATKYIWRADLKVNALEDLKKAVWYVQREIALREGKAAA